MRVVIRSDNERERAHKFIWFGGKVFFAGGGVKPGSSPNQRTFLISIRLSACWGEKFGGGINFFVPAAEKYFFYVENLVNHY